jgi:two-component system response regulator PilR (NtrC family)
MLSEDVMALCKVLVVDDEESIREFFEIMLKREGYEVWTASNGKEALERLKKGRADLILSDIQMPEMSGLELLSKVKEQDPEALMIMITAFGSTETAVEAMKLGAYDYVQKPFKIDEVKIILRQALERKQLQSENVQLKKELGTKYAFDNIVGSAPPMMRIYYS